MNEMKNIKCPLCGAPAVVRITDDPLWVGSDNKPTRIFYEYDKPEPPVPKLCGYEVQDLIMVAELMRGRSFSEEDLRDLGNNFERAFMLASEILRRDLEQQLRSFQGNIPKEGTNNAAVQ